MLNISAPSLSNVKVRGLFVGQNKTFKDISIPIYVFHQSNRQSKCLAKVLFLQNHKLMLIF